jgi:transposase
MEKVCGIDVHRDLLVTTILNDQTSNVKNFTNDLDDINNLKDWLNACQCNRAVMESTSIYWTPLYLALQEAGFNVCLANAHQVKAIPGRKTDQTDSEWLAYLLRGGLIKPSYVPEKRLRELRELTRLRIKYVQCRTAFKNRCHKVLNRVNIRLGSRLKDIFGKAGTEILNGLMAGKTVDSVLEHTENKWLKKRSDEIKAVAKGALSEMDILELKDLTDTIKHLDEKICGLDFRIVALVNAKDAKVVNEKEMAIASLFLVLVLGLCNYFLLRLAMRSGLARGNKFHLGLVCLLVFISLG